MDWISLVTEACSEFEYKNPGALQQIKENLTAENALDVDPDSRLAELYRDASACIVEPNVYLGRYEEDCDFYYEKCENEGMQFVKGGLGSLDSSELWGHVIDIVNEIGY